MEKIYKTYLFERVDGGVAIMRVIRPDNDGDTSADILWERSNDLFKEETTRNYVEIREADVPQDKVFRNAWTFNKNTKKINIDLNKAKEIKKNQFRDLRKAKFKELDIEFMLAIENGNDIKDISSKKKLLRDVTSIELPNDIEELKSFIPEILK